MRKGSSLRAQRSNLVDKAPSRIEIAPSPGTPAGRPSGVLAMTRFRLVAHCLVDFLQQPAAGSETSDVRGNFCHKLGDGRAPGHVRHYGDFGV